MKSLKSFEPLWLALTSSIPGGTVTKRSIESYTSKSKMDPVTFNCVTLPSLGKSIYSSLRTGTLLPNPFFKWDKGRPVFLRELFSRLFTEDGTLRRPLSSAQIKTLHKLLQLTMVFYKFEDASTCDNDRELVNGFRELQKSRENFLDGELTLEQLTLLNKAKCLIHRVLGNEDPREIRPYHGAGVVRTGESNWEKWTNHPYYPNLEKIFPSEEYNRASFSHLCDELVCGISNHPNEVERIGVRITTVPKNSKTRRMIAVEEAYPQYIKMGLMQKMYHIVEHHPLTSGYVNFTQQETNRLLAQIGSKWQCFATLDLSAASDSVYVGIIQRLFPRSWCEALLSTRATFATYKGEEFPLYTFATMGSACCFPVEALVFWAITSACVGHTQNFVYGDDIIVENDHALSVIRSLESLGFNVNVDKSYYTGSFRESCGADFFNGVSVTTVKLRHEPSTDDPSTIQYLNNLGKVFGEQVMIASYDAIVRIIDSYIPFTTDIGQSNTAVFVDRERSSNDVFLKSRWNTALQRREYRLLLSVPHTVQVEDNWFEVLRSLLGKGQEGSSCTYDDGRHIIQVWRWICLYPDRRS